MNFLAVAPRTHQGTRHRADLPSGRRNDRWHAGRRCAKRAGRCPAEPAEIGIRPEHIAIADPSDQRAHLTGVVQLVERLGNLTIVYLSTPAGQLVVEGSGEIAIRADDTVGLVFDASRTHVFDHDGRVL